MNYLKKINLYQVLFILTLLFIVFLPNSTVDAVAQCNISEGVTVTSYESYPMFSSYPFNVYNQEVVFNSFQECYSFCPGYYQGESTCTSSYGKINNVCTYNPYKHSVGTTYDTPQAYCTVGVPTGPSGTYCVPMDYGCLPPARGGTMTLIADYRVDETWCKKVYSCNLTLITGEFKSVAPSSCSPSAMFEGTPANCSVQYSTNQYCEILNSGGQYKELYTCPLSSPPTNVDIKATIWNDSGRSSIFGSQTGDGPLWAYSQAPYKITWGAVGNASSCTLNGTSVSISGGSIDTYTFPLNTTSLTYTLTCTSPTSETAENSVIINIPPAPTGGSGSCPSPGNLGSFSWTAPTQIVGGISSWNTFYTRLYQLPAWTALTTSPAWDDNFVDTAKNNFPTAAGVDYYWGVHTKLTTSPYSWSDLIGAGFTCTASATFPLTVTKAGTGAGTVTPSTGTITWSGNTGTANYTSGTSVTLTAAASAGSTFAGWSGGLCSGTGTCVVSMTQARSVTATFSFVPPPTNLIGTCPSPYTAANLNWTAPAGYNAFYVRLNPGASNYTWPISPGGIATEVTGTNWTPATTPGQSYTWWISTRDTVNGTYSADAVSYNLNCYGAVTTNISAGSTNLSYNTATNISWSSTNATSCSVSPTGWSGTSGTQSTGNLTSSRTYTVSCNPTGANSSASVTVNVQAQPKGLTVIKSGQGIIISDPAGINCGSDCTENYLAGTAVVLTATPSSGRIFTGWGTGCDSSTKNSDGSGGTCTVNMSTDKSIIANFAIDPNYKEF